MPTWRMQHESLLVWYSAVHGSAQVEIQDTTVDADGFQHGRFSISASRAQKHKRISFTGSLSQAKVRAIALLAELVEG